MEVYVAKTWAALSIDICHTENAITHKKSLQMVRELQLQTQRKVAGPRFSRQIGVFGTN